MNKGDMFSIESYEPMAMATGAEMGGRVVVIHNNSSHFIVAFQAWNTRNPNLYIFLDAIPFDDDVGEWRKHPAYRRALHRMMDEVLDM